MAREMDPEMLRRLLQQYAEMSNAELFELAATPDDLTDFALEILRGEMARRNLKTDLAQALTDDRRGVTRQDFTASPADGSVILMTFYDAIAAGRACDLLEAEDIGVSVRDVAEKDATSGSLYGGPPVALQLLVPQTDRERSMGILREKMGLFPLQEVTAADELQDDGTLTAVGYFANQTDADEIAAALDAAKIWHRVVANPEGTVQAEDAFSVEVREVDLFEAGDVVERAIS